MKSRPLNFGLIGSYNNNYKGIDIALKALAILRDKNGLNFKFYLLGSGQRDKIETYAHQCGVSNQLVLSGILKGGKDVVHWLDKLDIYLQPSRTEGLPRGLIEAMSRGIPAVGSDVGGIPELLPEKYLCKVDDAIDLANIIIGIIENYDYYITASEYNTKTARVYSQTNLTSARKRFWSLAAKEIS